MSITPKIVWVENRCIGETTDGYRIEIGAGTMPGKSFMRITAPAGATLHQVCASADSAKTNAATEIENHRRRGEWTR